MGKVATKKTETVKVLAVMGELNLSRQVVIDLITMGFFTRMRPSLKSPRGNYQIYADEVRELKRLRDKGLEHKRILSGMIDYRGRMGRK